MWSKSSFVVLNVDEYFTAHIKSNAQQVNRVVESQALPGATTTFITQSTCRENNLPTALFRWSMETWQSTMINTLSIVVIGPRFSMMLLWDRKRTEKNQQKFCSSSRMWKLWNYFQNFSRSINRFIPRCVFSVRVIWGFAKKAYV